MQQPQLSSWGLITATYFGFSRDNFICSIGYKYTCHQNGEEVFNWYGNESTGLGDSFLQSLDRSYSKIEVHPEYFSIVENKYRQVKLSGFPYVIVYRMRKDRVIVIPIWHTSRNPILKIKGK